MAELNEQTSEAAPEPVDVVLEKDLDTDEKIVLLLNKLITEQKNTIRDLHRIRGHLVFYSVAIILGIILGFFGWVYTELL